MNTYKKNGESRINKYDTKNWLIFVGFVDMLGVSFVVPALPLRALALNMTNVQIGFLVAVYGACQMISSPFVGSWSDAVGSKSLMISSIVATAFSYFLLGFAYNMKLFIAARIIAGIFKHTATLAEIFFSALLPNNEALAAISQYSAYSYIGMIVGPVVGGWLAASDDGFRIVCYTAGTIFLINAVIVSVFIPSIEKGQKGDKSEEKLDWFHSKQKSKNSKEAPPKDTGIFASLKTVDFAVFWRLFLFRFLTAFGAFLYRENFSLILREKYDVGVTVSGYILSYQAAMAAISGFAVAYWIHQFTFYCWLIYSSIVLCISLILFVFADTLTYLILILIPFTFSNSILRVVTLQELLALSREEQTGAIMGLVQSSFAFAKTISPIASGYLLDIEANGPAIGGAVVCFFAVLLAVDMILAQTRGQEKLAKCNVSHLLIDYFRSKFEWP